MKTTSELKEDVRKTREDLATAALAMDTHDCVASRDRFSQAAEAVRRAEKALNHRVSMVPQRSGTYYLANNNPVVVRRRAGRLVACIIEGPDPSVNKLAWAGKRVPTLTEWTDACDLLNDAQRGWDHVRSLVERAEGVAKEALMTAVPLLDHDDTRDTGEALIDLANEVLAVLKGE